jgi:hypothetical protein
MSKLLDTTVLVDVIREKEEAVDYVFSMIEGLRLEKPY